MTTKAVERQAEAIGGDIAQKGQTQGWRAHYNRNCPRSSAPQYRCCTSKWTARRFPWCAPSRHPVSLAAKPTSELQERANGRGSTNRPLIAHGHPTGKGCGAEVERLAGLNPHPAPTGGRARRVQIVNPGPPLRTENENSGKLTLKSRYVYENNTKAPPIKT